MLTNRLAALKEKLKQELPLVQQLDKSDTKQLFIELYKWRILHPDFSAVDFRYLISVLCESEWQSNGHWERKIEATLLNFYSMWITRAAIQLHNRYITISDILLLVPQNIQQELMQWICDSNNSATHRD